jgi:hypothetical protein
VWAPWAGGSFTSVLNCQHSSWLLSSSARHHIDLLLLSAQQYQMNLLLTHGSRDLQAPCDSSCGVHYADDPLEHFSWCPTFTVGKDGCIPGLTQVAPSASATANPICLPLPQVSPLIGMLQAQLAASWLPCMSAKTQRTVASAAPAANTCHAKDLTACGLEVHSAWWRGMKSCRWLLPRLL